MKSICIISFLVFIFNQYCLAQQSLFSAKHKYEDLVADIKANHGGNINLVLINTQSHFNSRPMLVDVLTGKAEMWIYAFHAIDENLLIIGQASDSSVTGLITGIIFSGEWDPQLDTTRIPDNWIDSPNAAEIWNSAGIHGYYDSRVDVVSLRMSLTRWRSKFLWGAKVTDGADTLACYVDLITSEHEMCSGITAVHDNIDQDNMCVSQIYPNPIRLGNEVSVEVPSGILGNSIYIYNMLGKYIGKIDVSPALRDRAVVRLPSNLLDVPGIYLLKWTKDMKIIIKKIIVLP